MPAGLPQLDALRRVPRDGRLLFVTRAVRLFAYGLISVVLVLYLAELHLSDARIGTLLSLTLLGDTAVSLWITTRADRFGRRRMLMLGAALMIAGGLAFALTDVFALLVIAATVAVISPTGSEVGPFLSIEQAALAQFVGTDRRTDVFAWYHLTGSVATALGALAAGLMVPLAERAGLTEAAAYRPALVAYAALGGVLCVLFTALSPGVEVPVDATAGPGPAPLLGLHRSRGVVTRLSLLFAIDSFGGGFIMQSLLAYWLHVRFGLDAAALGGVFLAANLLAGLSALAAGALARRIGLINTMVLTHLPSNVLLLLVPLMPSGQCAVALLLIRFSISQMDVPTRQAYTMAVVAPDERSAAAGITTVARFIGAALSPALATRLIAVPSLVNAPLFFAGGIKILYDLLLWRAFASHQPEQDQPRAPR